MRSALSLFILFALLLIYQPRLANAEESGNRVVSHESLQRRRTFINSPMLAHGKPLRWWRKNRLPVLLALYGRPAPTVPDLETALGPGPAMGQSRRMYVDVLKRHIGQATPGDKKKVWGGDEVWRDDVGVLARRFRMIEYSPALKKKDLSALDFMDAVIVYLSKTEPRRQRLLSFTKQDRIKASMAESLHMTLQAKRGEPDMDPDALIVDLVLLLEFLTLENKPLFLYGKEPNTKEARKLERRYAAVDRPLWSKANIRRFRTETAEILAALGPEALPVMEQVLEELEKRSPKSRRRKSLTLTEKSLAVSSNWVSRRVRFPVSVHDDFQKEIEALLEDMEGAELPATDIETPEANNALNKYLETILNVRGVKYAYVDPGDGDRDKPSIVIVVGSGFAKTKVKKIVGATLDKIPVRISVFK